MNRMHPYMFPGPEFGMRRWMWSDPWMGRMWRGYGRGWGQMPGRGMWSLPGDSASVWQHRPGMGMFGNIPGLTDKQRKDIETLRQKQQEEMGKLREEMMARMKSLRESNREKIICLLRNKRNGLRKIVINHRKDKQNAKNVRRFRFQSYLSAKICEISGKPKIISISIMTKCSWNCDGLLCRKARFNALNLTTKSH